MKGISIDGKNDNEDTALHLCILANKISCYDVLTKPPMGPRPDPYIRDKQGYVYVILQCLTVLVSGTLCLWRRIRYLGEAFDR